MLQGPLKLFIASELSLIGNSKLIKENICKEVLTHEKIGTFTSIRAISKDKQTGSLSVNFRRAIEWADVSNFHNTKYHKSIETTVAVTICQKYK